MAINVLRSTLTRLTTINRHCYISWKGFSGRSSASASASTSTCTSTSSLKNGATVSPKYDDVRVSFKAQSLNIDFELPQSYGAVTNIVDRPLTSLRRIQDFPLGWQWRSIVPVPGGRDDEESHLPPSGKRIVEKQAARLIVIRRRKMKKHKRKKLRKRMHYAWLKIKQQRELNKEKAFQAEMEAQLKRAELFDAEEHVAERLRILTRERLPKTWRGEVLPEAMIRQFMAEKQAKKDAKRNKPRLTLH